MYIHKDIKKHLKYNTLKIPYSKNPVIVIIHITIAKAAHKLSEKNQIKMNLVHVVYTCIQN